MLCQKILKIKCPRLAKNAFAIQHLLHHSIAYIFIHYNCTINYYKMNALIIAFPRVYLQVQVISFLLVRVFFSFFLGEIFSGTNGPVVRYFFHPCYEMSFKILQFRLDYISSPRILIQSLALPRT
jgi:hypothetical protein